MRNKRRPNILTKDYLKSLERSLTDDMNVNGAHMTRRGANLAISVPKQRPGRRSAGGSLRWVKLVSAVKGEQIYDDHLVVQFCDPVTGVTSGDPFNVAKPWHLQRAYSDGLTLNYDDGSSITYSFQNADYGTKRTADDGVDEWVEEIHPHYYGGSIFQIMPIALLTLAAPVQVTGTFSFQIVANAITRSSGSFVTDGFKPGMTLVVTGTANNDGTYRIKSVSALQMLLVDPGLSAETVNCTLAGTLTAAWMDANLQARFFIEPHEDLCLSGTCLEFDENGCLRFITSTNSQVTGTVVTGGSLSIVAGTPNKLRLTLTRAIATFDRNVCGVVVGVAFTNTSSITSDLNLDECN